MHIFVIGINYAPEPTGSAPYTSGLAEILAEAGYKISAIVGIPHYPSWTIRREDKYRLRYSEKINKVEVRRFRHFVPKRQTTFSRILWESTFLLNVLFSRRKQKPNLVFCSSPSLSGGLIGVYYSKKYRVPLITVVQDLVGKAINQSGLTSDQRVGILVGKLEKFIFRNSTKVCIVSPEFREYVLSSPICNEAIVNFPNWTHIQKSSLNYEMARAKFGWADDQFIILHTGNMGLKQDLGNVIETARLMTKFKSYRFVLCGDGNQKNYLIRASEGVGNIHFIQTVPESDYADLLTSADLLLVNEGKLVGNMSLPSKLTSYLSAGKPIIAAVDENGACASELATSNGAAIIVEPANPQALSEAIIKLSTDRELMHKMGLKANEYEVKYLSRSGAATRILDLIKICEIF